MKTDSVMSPLRPDLMGLDWWHDDQMVLLDEAWPAGQPADPPQAP